MADWSDLKTNERKVPAISRGMESSIEERHAEGYGVDWHCDLFVDDVWNVFVDVFLLVVCVLIEAMGVYKRERKKKRRESLRRGERDAMR